MVSRTNITSFTYSGVREWLIQRVSAVVLAGYFLFLMGYLVIKSPINFYDWFHLFGNPWMLIISTIVLFSIFAHAWIGLWRVTSDYLRGTILRLSVQIIVILSLLGLLVWGLAILWSV